MLTHDFARLHSAPLSSLLSRLLKGPAYLHEIKLDRSRMAARLDNGDVRLLTRTGLDWTTRYPAIAEARIKLSRVRR